jgi:PAS domain S-box-containing protein
LRIPLKSLGDAMTVPRRSFLVRFLNTLRQRILSAIDGMTGELPRKIEALRESESLFRNLAENAPVMVWITDQTGSTTYISRSWCDFTGQTPETALGQGWVDALHPDDRKRAHDAFLAANAGQEAIRLDYRLRRKDGKYRWMIDTAAPRRSETGQFLGYVGSVIDITDRREAEEALYISQALMSGIVASAMDAIITVDADQRIRVFNAAAERMFRCTVEEAIGESIDRYIPERFRDAHHRHIADFGYSNTTKRLMGSLGAVFGLRANGEEFLIEASISQIETAGQKLFTVILRDITARQQTEERLIEQAALLNHARDAILVRGLDDRIIFWNQSAERIYGWTAEEAVGRDVRELIYRGDTSEYEPAKLAVVEQGEWTGELRQITKDGKEVITEGSWTLVSDADGNPKSILSINTDVSEQKKLERQLFRAQRLESIGTLASGIAHDLNNILSPISMGVQLLQMKLTDESSQRMLEVIRQSADRGGDLIKQMLSFAKGGVEGQKTMLQPKHLIKEIIKILAETLPKNITLNYSLPPDLATINGDPTQLQQVMMNLCVNARDAMPDGGTLTIKAEMIHFDEHYARLNPDARPGPYVLITVSDTGLGIPAGILDRIFDPFFTTKEQGKGTGLGLPIVQGIVKGHGGFINIYSEQGRGAQFRIYLPANVSPQTTHAPVALSTLPAGHGETILVVDDEESIREITSTMLEKFGYQVLVASEGAEAVALYVAHKDEIAAVITDMMMPLMDGPATIRALMKIDPQVRIVASSGLADNERTAEAARLGVKNFLPKPYTAERLLVALDEVIGKATQEAIGSNPESL